MAKKQNKITLTLRITEPADIKMMNELKQTTGERTYSGALMRAGASYKLQQDRIRLANEQNNKLTEKITRANEVLQFIHSAQKMLNGYAEKNLPKGKFPERELFS